jgi:hypothetical protein
MFARIGADKIKDRFFEIGVRSRAARRDVSDLPIERESSREHLSTFGIDLSSARSTVSEKS